MRIEWCAGDSASTTAVRNLHFSASVAAHAARRAGHRAPARRPRAADRVRSVSKSPAEYLLALAAAPGERACPTFSNGAKNGKQ